MAATEAAGFTAPEQKGAGSSPAEMRIAGYTATEMRDAGFSAKKVKSAGYSGAARAMCSPCLSMMMGTPRSRPLVAGEASMKWARKSSATLCTAG